MNPDPGQPRPAFERLQPMPPAHPRARFPMLPVIGRAGTAGTASAGVAPASRFLEADVLFTASGAAAIHGALVDAGVGAGDDVVVPAYHCPTMVLPVLAAGAGVRFAHVTDGLALTLAAIERAAGARTRAVLLPHYFGFAQREIVEIANWCRARGAVLIEDCAHAFYGSRGGFVPGVAGDYAVASTRKFFAGAEGGALAANGRVLSVRPRGATLREEAGRLFDTVHLAARAGNLPRALQRMAGAPGVALEGPTDEDAARREAEPRPAEGAELGSSALVRRAARSTVALVRGADHARAAAVRRARWHRWADVLRETRGARAWRDVLPDSGVPYVFPVLLDDAESSFVRLKRAGVPVWRWDRLARSDCAASRDLGLRLVQLPCHQSLDDARFEAVLADFVAALAAPR